MYILAGKHIPRAALKKLAGFGEVLPFFTENITYPAISGHPDVFFTSDNNGLIVAPNLPLEMKNILINKKITFQEGNFEVGERYPQTAVYNAVVTEKLLIHHLKVTDSKVLERNGNREKIHVNQAYTRCNLLALKDDHFITSDRGIEKVLREKQYEVVYVNPEKIILPGMKHGFFGGCCGVFENKVFIIGNLDFFPGGKQVREFISQSGYHLVELYEGPMFDGGGLFII